MVSVSSVGDVSNNSPPTTIRGREDNTNITTDWII